MTTTILLFIAIPVFALILCRFCYCWGHTTGYLQSTQDHHAEHIKKLNVAWRAGVSAERMRAFSPKNVSKN